MTDRTSLGVERQANSSEPEIVTIGIKQAVQACLVIEITIFIITIWILFSLILHGRKFKKWNLKTTKGRVFVSAFVAIALGLPRFGFIFMAQIVILNDHLCETYTNIEFVLTCLPMMTTYIFLWIRQRTLRHNGFVRILLPRWVNSASNCLLPVIFISFAFMIVLFVFPAEYEFHELGCKVGPVGPNYFGFITYGSLLVMQISFVGLFVFPMTLIVRRRNGEKDRMRYKQQSQLVSRVKRYIICSVIVVVSDFSPLAFSYTTINPSLITFNRALVNVDVLINQLCMLGTFDPFIPLICCSFSTKDSRKSRTDDGSSLPNIPEVG